MSAGFPSKEITLFNLSSSIDCDYNSIIPDTCSLPFCLFCIIGYEIDIIHRDNFLKRLYFIYICSAQIFLHLLAYLIHLLLHDEACARSADHARHIQLLAGKLSASLIFFACKWLVVEHLYFGTLNLIVKRAFNLFSTLELILISLTFSWLRE